MDVSDDPHFLCEDLKSKNADLQQQVEAQRKVIEKLNRELSDVQEKSSLYCSRIITAGQLLNEKKHEHEELSQKYEELQKEYKERIKSDEEKVESLERLIASKEAESTAKDTKIKSLNERIEALLVSSVEETQKRNQLQSRYEMMENSLLALQNGTNDESASPVPGLSILSSSALYDLLSETQEKVEDLQTQLSSLDKEYAKVCSNRDSILSEYQNHKQQYEEALLRDKELQAVTSVLQNQLIQSETRFKELSESIGAESKDSVDQQRIHLLKESNQRLLEVLKASTGLQHIPFGGAGNYLSQLESKYNETIHSLHEEKAKHRIIENELIELKAEYERLTINYHKLVNPVEQLECDVAMQQEPDIMIVRAALTEKLHHLMELSTQLEERESEHQQNRKKLAAAYEQIITLKELLAEQDCEIQQQTDRSQLMETALKQKQEESDQLQELMDEEREKLEQKCSSEVMVRETQIQELMDKLTKSETANQELQTSIQTQTEQSDIQIHQLEEKVSEKEVLCENWRSACNEFCTKILTLAFSVCDTCNNHSIEPILCDQIQRVASHLGSVTINIRFSNDMIQIIEDMISLVEHGIDSYLVKNETEAKKKDDEQQQSIRELEEQVRTLRSHVQQLEGYDATLNTMISFDTNNPSDVANDTSSIAYWKKQTETLTSTNQILLRQIDELSACVQSSLTQTQSLDTIDSNDPSVLRAQLQREHSATVLWSTHAEHLEVLLRECENNRSSLTDYELLILNTVIDGLLSYVMDRLVLDLDLQVSLETLEEEYIVNVRQLEGREPTLMETKLYAVQRIIEASVTWLLDSKYELEMEVGAEHDRRCEVEMLLQRK